MSKEGVGVVSIADDLEDVAGSLAHVVTVAGVLGEVEGGGNHVTSGSGKGHGEVLVEKSEGLVEITDSSGGDEGSKVRHDGGEELNDEVQRGEEGVESILSELIVTVKGALEAVGASHGVGSRR